ncbi:type I-F CRISPR-associated endoribonuclease Cas6/Csy4 [Photobacterium proteolyticum]|uniref:Type I-F CRISPR-associated endoribonuclease Cas6/Csy4 n=1 Tax=Photobacterium proteolyticum TaxID=1903952 RepID=A0A1Q9GF48_9GAMM|nr:type I-F CRISPR-associated endoribonuclease Cas6/Csy4 [Photobacterium proteolyticum]OLQ72986.1 type I-F CRISPR-associated endoribonuclease Cas6/Csy4 [Photobacterium proteolyticum]
MAWFYKTIRFLPERRNNEALVSKCLRVLHSFNYEYETRNIGVSFPMWCEQTIGNQLTFVSMDRMQLDYLLRWHSYFDEMVRLGYFAVSNTQEVPESINYVAFERNCSIDRLTPVGHAKKLKRLKERAEARGEVFEPKKYYSRTSISVDGHYHSIENVSNKKFRLNIVRVETPERATTGYFSSYGLANSENNYQTVPEI